MADDDLLILVDDQDRELGFLDKRPAHDGDGVKHRAFSVFLFDRKGRLLLQQRAEAKRLWGGYWSNTCCSHPRKGEATGDAAHRRLLEELGTGTETLEHLFGFSYEARFGELGSENEYCHVYFGRLTNQPKVDPDEIKAVRWITVIDLNAALEASPADFTPWFKQEWACIQSEHGDVLARYTSG